MQKKKQRQSRDSVGRPNEQPAWKRVERCVTNSGNLSLYLHLKLMLLLLLLLLLLSVAESKKNRENQFPFSFCGQRSAQKTKQMSDWRAGRRMKRQAEWSNPLSYAPSRGLTAESRPSVEAEGLTDRRMDSRTDGQTGQQRRNQEMRLTFEQWAKRQRRDAFCGAARCTLFVPHGVCLIWMKWQRC